MANFSGIFHQEITEDQAISEFILREKETKCFTSDSSSSLRRIEPGLTPDLAYLEIGLEELSRAVNPGVNEPESERDAPSGTQD